MLHNINAEMARRNISQNELAEQFGVTRRTLYNWISETTELPSSFLVRMAKMWNCTTDYLLGLEIDKAS
ncbi:MAG: helix-turn-helix transcriptional regulator [Anaerotignum sp.]|nr:helix-turn-helix transcriptional regulator [Anaerotignum sp.]